ncbi:hypothetical protein [Xanthomonas sp. 3075]|nr:hypothetical protein [Xanthomonas sp. 3075]MBB4130553.1 hypothetical protein [Xanthomonas sp. 3075]
MALQLTASVLVGAPAHTLGKHARRDSMYANANGEPKLAVCVMT